MQKPNPTVARADQVEKALRKSVAAGILSWSDLLSLHGSFATRFAADNAGIWSTGAIFVPAALAAPIAYFAIANESWGALAVFTTSSVLTISAWLVIAETHRAFQNRSMAVILGIEQALGLSKAFGNPKLIEPDFASRMYTCLPVKTLRRSLLPIVTGLWATIWIAKLAE